MDSAPLPQSKDQTTGSPEPEALKPRVVDEAVSAAAPASAVHPTATPATGKRPKHRNYRPSHKATFIGAAVVIIILVVNAGILAFVLKNQSKTIELGANGAVTVSPSVLKKLGVSSSTLGNPGVQLVVDPDAQFKGKLSVAGNVNVSGQVQLNNKLTGTDASLTQLEAGNTALSQLNVNGSSTLSNLNLRNGLVVTGSTQLQGTVTISQLLTVNNSLNVSGNLSIGGTLSVNTFSARNIVSTGSIGIGGHIITSGPTPSVGPGPGLGTNGTVSISGNDTAGTVSVNIGVPSGNGVAAQVAFHNQYATTPHVVVTAVDGSAAGFYITRNSSGFNIVVVNLPPGGYAFDYIVEQ